MAVINTNTKALFSQSALKRTEGSMSKAMEQLSTGKRINSASDDAAGMAIATRMSHQIRSLNQAVRNAGDAINLIQTAEGATNEITDMMIRMRELAIQAVNDTNANEQRSYLDLEFQQLKQEIVRIADVTEWNGFPVLNGTAGERVGEMPVFKTTSVSQFGSVLIDPTTVRTLAGTDDGDGVGERQEVVFSGTPSTSTSTGFITIAGVEINVTADDFDDGDLASYLTFITEKLSEDDQFSVDSGRTVEFDGVDTIKFTYTASDGDVDKITVYPPSDLSYTNPDAPARNAITNAKETFTDSGKFLKSGSLTIEYPGSGDVASAIFTTETGEEITMTGVLDTVNGTISFSDTDDFNASVLSGSLTYTFRNSDGDAEDISSRAVSLSVNVAGSIPSLRAGDLQINGIEIGASSADDDLLSPPNNASGSAIAKAAAINRRARDSGITAGETQTIAISGTPIPGTVVIGGVAVQITAAESTSVLATAKIAATLNSSTAFGAESGRSVRYAPGSTTLVIDFAANEGDVAKLTMSPGSTTLNGLVETTRTHSTMLPGTGVYAKVNENVLTGRAMSAESVATGTVFINGFASADITTTLNNTRQTRSSVVAAINAISDRTGVKAIDTGFDSQGVTLLATDGRNIEVRFETDSNSDLFGTRIGLREGVQSSTVSLESRVQAPVVLTSSATGDISRAGLIEGNFTKNQSVFNTDMRAPVVMPQAQLEAITIDDGALVDGEIFSVTINGYTFEAEVDSTANPAVETAQDIRDALVEAINTKASVMGVTASAGRSISELTLSANTAGTPFTYSVETDSVAATMPTQTVAKNVPADFKPLNAGDLVINGIKIRATSSADDNLSNRVAASSDPSSSAIALAAAINSHSSETGVRAQANPVVSKGLSTYTAYPDSGTYNLFVNGTTIEVDFEKGEAYSARRAKVIDAINQRVGQHGVTASDNGNGVTLESDGRNVSVWFDGGVKDLTAVSFGLEKGGSIEQVSRIVLGADAANTNSDDTASVVINGVTITSDTDAAIANGTDLASALFQKIQEKIDAGEIRNVEVSYDSGTTITITSTIAGTPFSLTGAAVASDDATLKIESVTANSVGNNDVIGLRAAKDHDGTDPVYVSNKALGAKTLYGTVRMISDPALLPLGLPSPIGAPPSDQEALVRATGKPFTVSAGVKGFGEDSNFASLGFQAGTFGGRASTDLDPPRVGRLAFQVGSGSNQMITIDLADFGKGGPITGEITGDVDLNVEQRRTRINTREGASSVLALLDTAMDKVNATRATMGAVMNRLEHTINNLSNVSTNLSASRSQIEDADYAAASTEMAKTQIMQQAATSVLAQANMSQQTVLKLLGG